MLSDISLKPNDKVGLICTGSICLQADHPHITQTFLREQYGLNSIFKHDTVQAIHPSERADIFLEYLFNPDIKLITAIRGGEGTADILPFIHQQYKKIKLLPPKFILGFSDFTALLVYFAKYYQWPVIHGSSPLQFALNKVDKQTEEITMRLLFCGLQNAEMSLIPLNDKANTPGIIQAELTGGCLSLIDISIKDIWEIETENKILFFEDVSEKAHKIIRSLKYFSRIGLFQSVKAIIFGDFNAELIGCDNIQQENNRANIMKILKSFAENQNFPVLHTHHFGHGKTNWPLVYSSTYYLKLGKKPIFYKM
ncbi:MAG: LD-carboxypeptidase [Gammaproteobacteria bacterium]|nr:LD-carboxypeptidase [Gammaproteobacteria bacterium]